MKSIYFSSRRRNHRRMATEYLARRPSSILVKIGRSAKLGRGRRRRLEYPDVCDVRRTKNDPAVLNECRARKGVRASRTPLRRVRVRQGRPWIEHAYVRALIRRKDDVARGQETPPVKCTEPCICLNIRVSQSHWIEYTYVRRS